jgi:hypothetical protein
MPWSEALLWTIFGICLAVGCRPFIEWMTYINNRD